MTMILAGDIGGTKCNLALFVENGAGLRLAAQQRYSTSEFGSLEQLIEKFFYECKAETALKPTGKISAAGFGVAGAVVDGRLVANNIPWQLTTAGLADKLQLGLDQLVVINDLVATAYGLPHLARQDFLVLNSGTAQANGTQALMAAGTGLGQAMIFWDGHQHRASPSEGGAADFAPRTEREVGLLQFLKQRMPRVSCEEIFSGRGFRKLHEFLDPAVRHSTFQEPDAASASEITQNAMEGSCAVCVEVLDWWITAFGAEAGNLALRVLAYGGVYFAGGIILKILPKLQKGSFCHSFADKGRLGPILSNIPLAVVLNENAPVIGAAYQAFATTEFEGRHGQ
jgi:glucokinase